MIADTKPLQTTVNTIKTTGDSLEVQSDLKVAGKIIAKNLIIEEDDDKVCMKKSSLYPDIEQETLKVLIDKLLELKTNDNKSTISFILDKLLDGKNSNDEVKKILTEKLLDKSKKGSDFVSSILDSVLEKNKDKDVVMSLLKKLLMNDVDLDILQKDDGEFTINLDSSSKPFKTVEVMKDTNTFFYIYFIIDDTDIKILNETSKGFKNLKFDYNSASKTLKFSFTQKGKKIKMNELKYYVS